VGKVYVTVAAGTVDPPPTGDLFFNPFNKWSVQHRPIGSSITPGIPQSTTNNSTYSGGTQAAADINAAMDRIGDIIMSAGQANRKYMFRVKNTDPNRIIGWLGDHNGDGVRDAGGGFGSGMGFSNGSRFVTRTKRMPTEGSTTADGQVVEYPTSGDASLVLWPEDGNTGVDMIVGMNQYRHNSPASGTPPGDNRQAEARFLVRYPLSGVDYAGDDSFDVGFSAADIRYPFGWLRGFEINPTSPAPIYHPLQAGCTRESSQAQKPVAEGGLGRAIPEAHILGKTWCWPASGRDSGAGNSDQNLGPFPYGTRLFIPATAANLALRASAPGGNRGKVLFDCCMYYGILLIDGHGQWVGSGASVKGRLQIRNEDNVSNAAKADCNSFFGWLANQKILRPQFNVVRRANAKSGENGTNGLPYAGGGGTLDGLPNASSKSRNNAWDA
jgi:hypothetical protein